jgi:hypothetical protein
MQTAKPLKPYKHCHATWRGGQVWNIAGDTTTIRLMADPNIVRDKAVATSALPTGAIVGDPVVCRVTGDNADAYVIAEVRPSRFAAGDDPNGPNTSQVASVARGEFRPGVITPNEDADCWGFY